MPSPRPLEKDRQGTPSGPLPFGDKHVTGSAVNSDCRAIPRRLPKGGECAAPPSGRWPRPGRMVSEGRLSHVPFTAMGPTVQEC
jgi:hypothetical protein